VASGSVAPLPGLAILGAAAGLVAFTSPGRVLVHAGFGDGPVGRNRGLLVGIVLLVNWIAAFSLARMFGLIFAGKTQQMTIRAPEPLWLLVVPMTIGLGFTLHLPLIMAQLNLLPAWADVSKDMALLLTWSSILGAAVGTLLYVNRVIENPAS
jgi:NAD(P)H-quinone oxidoreductase subunit 5